MENSNLDKILVMAADTFHIAEEETIAIFEKDAISLSEIMFAISGRRPSSILEDVFCSVHLQGAQYLCDLYKDVVDDIEARTKAAKSFFRRRNDTPSRYGTTRYEYFINPKKFLLWLIKTEKLHVFARENFSHMEDIATRIFPNIAKSRGTKPSVKRMGWKQRIFEIAKKYNMESKEVFKSDEGKLILREIKRHYKTDESLRSNKSELLNEVQKMLDLQKR